MSNPVPGFDSSPRLAAEGGKEDLTKLLADLRDHLSKASGDGTYDDMGSDLTARMGKLEGSMEGLRHSQNLMVGVCAVAVTVGVFFGGYLLTRVDALGAKLDALPSQISSDIQELNRTLSQSITAARSMEGREPTVIVVPSAATPAIEAPTPR